MKKIILLLAGAAILCGCNKQTTTQTGDYEIVVVTNRSSTVYEMNKLNGGVFMISGSEYTPVKMSEASLQDTNSYLVDWGTLTLSFQTNSSLQFQMKTKWKSGVLHYILTVSPYEGLLEKEVLAAQSLSSQSQFIGQLSGPQLNEFFYDADGFKVVTIEILLSSLASIPTQTDATGKTFISVDGTYACSREDYQSFKGWGTSSQGFQ
jgi:hypothetical protein